LVIGEKNNMAAEVSVSTILELTGLGSEEFISNKFTSGTTPYEVIKGKPLFGDTAHTLDLGDIAAGKGYLLYLKAITNNFYFILGATTGTPAVNNSHLYLAEGEHCVLPINPNATIMTGIRYIGSASTAQLEYMLIGKE